MHPLHFNGCYPLSRCSPGLLCLTSDLVNSQVPFIVSGGLFFASISLLASFFLTWLHKFALLWSHLHLFPGQLRALLDHVVCDPARWFAFTFWLCMHSVPMAPFIPFVCAFSSRKVNTFFFLGVDVHGFPLDPRVPPPLFTDHLLPPPPVRVGHFFLSFEPSRRCSTSCPFL